MLHVSLLGEQTITHDRPGSVPVRSTRAVVLVTFLVTQRLTSAPAPIARCSSRNPPTRRRSPTCAASCTTCARSWRTSLRSS